MSIETPQRAAELPVAVIRNMVTLATSGFGVVVALAWNEVIKKTVEQYIDPYLGKGGGLISLLIYAVAMTLLAVIVTMQLVGAQRQLERIGERLLRKKSKEIEANAAEKVAEETK